MNIINFDFQGETIEAPLTQISATDLPEQVLALVDDEKCIVDEVFYQRHQRYFICYSQSKGWFGLHIKD